MIGEPRITVDCDSCGEEEQFEMTSLACSAWDARNLKRVMERRGWLIDGDRTYCSCECLDAAIKAGAPQSP